MKTGPEVVTIVHGVLGVPDVVGLGLGELPGVPDGLGLGLGVLPVVPDGLGLGLGSGVGLTVVVMQVVTGPAPP